MHDDLLRDLLGIIEREKPEWLANREPIDKWSYFIRATCAELREAVARADDAPPRYRVHMN